MAKIAVLGTLDTKGVEHGFVAEVIRARGHEAVLIDVGSGGAPDGDASSESRTGGGSGWGGFGEDHGAARSG
jgi:uncharacterized protein (UPF0261 family)